MFQTQHSEPFTVIGLALRTTNAEAFETIPAHWQRFYRDELLARIPGKLSDDVIALYTHFEHAGRDNDGEYTFVIGAPVTADAVPPEGLIQVDVPAVRCAVFEVERGHPERVGETWRTIWQQQGLPRRYVCDHERYRTDGRIHIHVGLR
ncbi:AraC family transcriptional regulator [Aquincola sp. S2]|uniref:AraC family transcriptional regulator n=1 Tax=Pseudaquabacterium terrae TaxID=2732868 RepID=A0ABX2EI70_9BURK|nr:GyrI-like domain-containing protein [Aquabacterium terrae]NRF68342.1 AraC family transcriptional regulator [Aquabacterium terrae]